MHMLKKEQLIALGIDKDEAEVFMKYAEVSHVKSGQDLLSHLIVRDADDPMRVAHVTSRKLSNIYFNWKKLLLETLPLVAGVVSMISQNQILAVLVGLRALKSAVDLTEVELNDSYAKVIIDLYRLSITNSLNFKWIDVDELAKRSGSDRNHLIRQSQHLKRLGVVALDLFNTKAILIESIKVEASN